MLKASVKHLIWWSLMLAMLIGIVLLALRLALPRVGDYRDEIAEYLGDALGVHLEIATLDARWEGYFPALSVGGLRVLSAGEQGPELRLGIDSIEARVDPWRSLLRLQPIFEKLEFRAVDGFWQQRDGRWLHRPGIGADSSGMSEQGWRRLLGLILGQPRVSIRDSRLMMIPEVGSARRLESVDALLENAADRHQLSGELSMAGLGEDTHLQFAVQFEGTAEDPLRGDYPFYLKLDSLGPELFNLIDLEIPLIRLRAGTEFWGRWHDGALASLQGALAVGELEYGAAPKRILLTNSHLDFALLPKAQGYQLQLNDIHLNTAGAELVVPQVLLEGEGLRPSVVPRRVAVPELELAPLVDWLLQQAALPERVAEVVDALKPSGRLGNLVVEWPVGGEWRDFALQADADGLAVQAYYGAPAAAGVSGLLQADIAGGALHLTSDRFDLHFPKLYPQGWHFNRADGIVRWELSPESALIHSELLHLGEPGVSAAGRFSIDIPYDSERQTELTLQIGITDADAGLAQSFTPEHEVGSGLYNWLGNAIQAGAIRQAGLLLHGGTRSLEPRRPPTVQLFFDIGRAQLKYDPDWPSLDDADLFLYIRNGDLRIDIRHAALLDSTIKAGWAYKPLHEPRLKVLAEVKGPAADLERVLRSKPLQSVGEALDDWHFDGDMETDLVLDIPVQSEAGAKLNVAAKGRLIDAGLGSESKRLQLSALNGVLSYTTAGGLAGTGLKGRLFGQTIGGQISTRSGVTRVEMKGRLPLEEARRWTGVDQLKLMRGTLGYTAALVLSNGQADCVDRLEIDSDLEGVAVDLPSPLRLSESQPGELKLRLEPASQQLDFSYRQALKGRFDLSRQALRGTLHLGEGDAVLRQDAGLYIDGSLAQLEVGELMTLLERLQSAPSAEPSEEGAQASESGAEALQEVDLSIGQLRAGGQVLNDLRAIVKPEPDGWGVRLEGRDIAGEVQIPDDERPLAIRLSRLSLGQLPTAGEPAVDAEEDGEEVAELLAPDSLRPADIEIEQLSFKGRDWGRWSANLRPEGKRLRVRNIDARLAQISLKGELNWLTGAHPYTGLTLKIEGKDIGRQLERWKLEKALESEELSADLQLEWPGAPWSIASARLDGMTRFKFKNGRLIESGDSANLLRVFGILNFNTLGRRLRLDFSDLLQKGVAFDRLEGHYRIEQGVATTLDPLLMEGPSANLKATGSLNLVDETVDKEMEVVLPLASNVPFAAVLLGAPQVAGAVFLIDKLIGDKLEKVTTLKYRISGDWGEPQVELQTQGVKQAEER